MRARGLNGEGAVHGMRRTAVVGGIIAVTAVLWLSITVVAADPVSAHADFIESDPPHGAVLDVPVTEIEVTFTAEVEPRGSGIGLVGADGEDVPFTVLQRTGDHLVVQPDTELVAGIFILRWAVTAQDGHDLEGVVRFEILGGAEDGTATGDDGGEVPAGAPDTATVDPGEEAPTTIAPVRPSTEAAPGATETVATDIDFTQDAAGDDGLNDLVGAVGRWLSLLGALVAIGATAFAAFGLIGTRSEISRVVGWIRAAGVAIVAGTVLEVAASAVAASGSGVLTDPVGFLDALPTSLARAAVLRLAGGIALLQSPMLVTTSRRTPDMAQVGAGSMADPPPTGDRDDTHRLVVREEWLVLAGLAAITASYLVDGHSASLGLLGRTANLVHVVAGGVWLGGVVVLGDLTMRRSRAGFPTGLAESTVRFSRVATVAVVAVAVAGGLLAWSIVDDPGDLASGTWGRLLVGKVALVAVAAGIGAYNHFRVVPRLEADPDGASTLARTLTAEGIALVLVVAVTAALVVSAP